MLGGQRVLVGQRLFSFFYLLWEKPLGSKPLYTNTSCLMRNGLQTYMKCFSVCLCGCVFVCKTPDNEWSSHLFTSFLHAISNHSNNLETLELKRTCRNDMSVMPRILRTFSRLACWKYPFHLRVEGRDGMCHLFFRWCTVKFELIR